MGLMIALIRKRELKLRQAEAEYKLTTITQARSVARKSVDRLLRVGIDYEPDSRDAKELEIYKNELKDYEAMLDARKDELENQLKEISAELQSCDQMIDAHIKSSFSYNIAS